MPIPEEILAVKRPTNSVVHAYGKNKDRYAVILRKGCKYKNGKHYPVNGQTIGHIIDGVYVPIPEEQPVPLSFSPVTLKNWGAEQLCLDLSQTLLDELKAVYNEKDAVRMLAIAILRVTTSGITDNELKDAYDESFLSELLPQVGLSRNSVSTFLYNLGKDIARQREFMRRRAEKVHTDHHLLVDGTLKTDNSKVDSLSEFSRKARMKNSKELSILYAFDLEEKEPICSQCYPGNMLDLTAYEDFVKNNGIQRGILVGDKGFPEKSIHEVLKDCPDLHYLNPLRRSSKMAMDYGMYEYDGLLEGCDGFLGLEEPVQYKKAKLKNVDKWLYSFRDSARAAKEESDWLLRHKGEKYDKDELRKKKEKFGTVVFESDIDLTPAQAWEAYKCRWEIEIVMRYYKSALEFDTTREHDDYSVYGSEFIDFLSVIITFRLLKLFDRKDLLKKFTYKKLMKILRKAKKAKTGEQWELMKLNPGQVDVLISLGLVEAPAKPEKRKRGRPRKHPV